MARLKRDKILKKIKFQDLLHYLTLIVSFFACQGLGRFSEALVLFSILSLISLFFSKLRSASILGFISTISLAMMTTQSSDWAILIPFFSIWLTRQCLLKEEGYSGSLYILLSSLLIAILLSPLNDRDWISFFLLTAGYAAPVFSWKGLKESIPTYIVTSLIFAGFVPLGFIYYHNLPKKEVAFLKGSAWAQTENKLDKDAKLDIATMYSYSELVELLQAKEIEIKNLDDHFGEAWIITPTNPFTEEQKMRILSWIRDGGRLILVTDHTDLFGHATVINGLLTDLNIKTESDAFFPKDPIDCAQVSLNKDIPLKTANTQTGLFLWPTMTARWISEQADYSNKNFFGPMRATGSTDYGRRTISGSIAHGKGQIILFGDSTIFANFAIYQPGIIPFLEHLRTPKLLTFLHLYIVGLIIIGWIICLVFRKAIILFASSLLGLWGIADISTTPISWPKFIPVFGNPKLLSEWTAPDKSFSTAYSFIPLIGKKPRWINQISENNKGLWLSQDPPPDNRWIWINPNPSEIPYKEENPFQELLEKITKHKPKDWSSCFNSVQKNNFGNIWTNDALGEWWLDTGISISKQARIEAWLSYIQQKDFDKTNKIPLLTINADTQSYKLKINNNDWETIILPKFDSGIHEEVYLGRGVSAKIVTLEDGKKILLGTQSMIEGWFVAPSWVLIPE